MFFVKDQLKYEAKQNEENKNQLCIEIKNLKEKLDDNLVEKRKLTPNSCDEFKKVSAYLIFF